MLEEAVKIAESEDLFREAMRGHNNLSVLLGFQGEYRAGLDNQRRAVELARRTGRITNQVFFANNVIWDLLFLGQIQEVEASYTTLEPLLDQIPDPELGNRMTRNSRGFYLFLKGDFEAADRLIEESIQEETETNDLHSLQTSLNNKSSLLNAVGDFQEAEEVAMRGVEISGKIGEGEIQLLFASVAASRQGAADRAAGHLESALKHIGESQMTFVRQFSLLRAEAHLHAAKDEWDEAWAKFEELDRLIAEKQVLGIDHWMKTEWADNLLLRGEAEDVARAQEVLEQAKSVAIDMEANGWVALIDEKLEAIGTNS